MQTVRLDSNRYGRLFCIRLMCAVLIGLAIFLWVSDNEQTLGQVLFGITTGGLLTSFLIEWKIAQWRRQRQIRHDEAVLVSDSPVVNP